MTHETKQSDESSQTTEVVEITGPGRPGLLRRRFEHAMSGVRYLFLIPVVFLLLTAAGSFIYGADIFLRTAAGDVSAPKQIGGRLGIFLIILDTFLVGATLVVVAVGFYELFIVRRPLPEGSPLLPRWLRMRDLEDLKARVVSMLILVSAITFADILVEQHSGQDAFFTGLAVAVIIAALTLFLRFGQDRGRRDRERDRGPGG